MRQVCNQLELCIGQTAHGTKAVLKREGVANSSGEQLSETRKKATEEYCTILLLYMADKYQYSKFIEDMEKVVLQKKDWFPKNVSDGCRILNGWRNVLCILNPTAE